MGNNKKRRAGSGTTTGKRREQRQAIPWSALQQADQPVATHSDMEKRLEALKKATKSAEEQLKKLEKAEQQSKRASSRSGKNGLRAQEAGWTQQEKPKPVSLAQVQKEQEVEERLASLKKGLEASFNKPTGSASSAAPPAASLKKEEALKKAEALNKDSAAESSLKKVDRPLVIIDWHNDQVREGFQGVLPGQRT